MEAVRSSCRIALDTCRQGSSILLRTTNSMRICELQEQDRPRERLARDGPAALSDAELLAILLGSGSRDESAIGLGSRLAAAFTIAQLAQALPEELCTLKGLGPVKAGRLIAAFELHRRLRVQAAPTHILSSDDGYAYALPLIGRREQEHVLAVFLDVRHRVLGHEIVTKGLADSALIHAREVFRGAVRRNAHAVLIAHNHPSGDRTPSVDDRAATLALAQAGKILGIALLDHLVITEDGYESAMPE